MCWRWLQESGPELGTEWIHDLRIDLPEVGPAGGLRVDGFAGNILRLTAARDISLYAANDAWEGFPQGVHYCHTAKLLYIT